ncbi:hypothetical protein DA83_25195 [Pseudomonas sp. 250J]|uniref:hypothetical protein n=1 Tax=unclassified Pseudomonas TaxID=196821 RepID=UPI00069A3902|nr:MULTISPECIES: hypothetical protein [unclassified Pseudomonas]KNX78050.1 hypothetical protein DA83_25195 [Pseudomonas sp. 250J]QZA52026.1 hypothetical protein K2O50_13315 [Pseudomonas sp. 2hn]
MTDAAQSALLPTVIFPRKMSTAWCAMAFEELEDALSLMDPGINELNPKQRYLWERYKVMTRQFAHDMLLAEGNSEEIDRRLGLERSDYLPQAE